MNNVIEDIKSSEFKIGDRVYFNIPESEVIGIVIGYIVYNTHLEYQIRTEQGVHQLESIFLSKTKVIV